MEFRADTNLPPEELKELGQHFGEILALELKLPPSEVHVEVEMREDPEDSDTINIFYLISIRGEAPDDLETYRAQQLFERLMGYDETMLN